MKIRKNFKESLKNKIKRRNLTQENKRILAFIIGDLDFSFVTQVDSDKPGTHMPELTYPNLFEEFLESFDLEHKVLRDKKVQRSIGKYLNLPQMFIVKYHTKMSQQLQTASQNTRYVCIKLFDLIL